MVLFPIVKILTEIIFTFDGEISLTSLGALYLFQSSERQRYQKNEILIENSN